MLAVRRGAAIAGFVILGGALWAARGVLDIAGLGQDVVRVAMLPPWWLLGVTVTSCAMIGAALSQRGGDLSLAYPLGGLLLAVLPFLPWLPDRIPALRAAAGPAKGVVWLVVLWLILARGGRVRRPRSLTPVSVFLLSVMVFGAVAARLGGTSLFPGGDEPHYLVITQSLIKDHDLKIENNHRQGDYRAYFGHDLSPHYLTRGTDGEIYSVHPVGMPILAVPAFAIAGYWGVVVMLLLMAALAATLLWMRARDVTGSTEAATFAWAAAALTAPFLFNSFTVYPEIPGALAVMVALTWRVESDATWVMALRGIAIGALPWLSTKYAPMAAVVGLIVFARSMRHVRGVVALCVPAALMVAGWFAFFHAYWGTFSPSAPYGTQENMALAYLAKGGLGLLFDQEYGVVALAPVFVLAIAGLAMMIRTGGAARTRALEVAAVFGALLVTVGAFHVWWGGTSAPARPVASAVLLLGLPIAWVFANARALASPAWRAWCHLLLASSIAIALVLLFARHGDLLNNDRDGSSVLLEWLSPTWPLWSAFPSFIAGTLAAAVTRVLVWVAFLLAGAFVIGACRPRTFGAASALAIGIGATGAIAVASLAAPQAEPMMAPDARARVPLFDDFDTVRRPVSIIYNPFSRVAGTDLLARMPLVVRSDARRDPPPLALLWNARLALPAGAYRLELTRATSAPSSLSLQVGRAGEPYLTWPVGGAEVDQMFTLPVDAAFVGFRAPADFGGGQFRLTPLRILDAVRRPDAPEVIRTVRYGAITAFIHDDQIGGEPTGFWTRGGVATHVSFAASVGAPTTVDVNVRCGPIVNRIEFRMPGWNMASTIAPGQSTAFKIPMAPQPITGPIASVEIRVRDAFVPSEIDTNSHDTRRLGCWIEMPKTGS
jgi:hypothetical protein